MILVTILANGLESFFSRHTPRVICGAINAFHLTLFSDSLRIMRKNVSIDEPLVKKWDVTGDDGTSRFSLILLRIMTTVFFIGTAYFVLLLTGLFDVFSWPMPLQTLQMVTGIIIVFILIGLWGAISIHPLCGASPIVLKLVVLLGYFFSFLIGFDYLKTVSDAVSDWAVDPVLLSFGLPLIVAAIGLIPITRTAWTMTPRSSAD